MSWAPRRSVDGQRPHRARPRRPRASRFRRGVREHDRGDMAEAGALQLALGAVSGAGVGRRPWWTPTVRVAKERTACPRQGGRGEGRTASGSPAGPAPQQAGALARAPALEARLDSIAGDPDDEQMRDMLEGAQRLAGEGHMAEADALLTRLERDVALGEDVSAKGGLERGVGNEEPEWLSRVAEYTPGESAPVRLDATAPLADGATGLRRLEHVQPAVARFEVEGRHRGPARPARALVGRRLAQHALQRLPWLAHGRGRERVRDARPRLATSPSPCRWSGASIFSIGAPAAGTTSRRPRGLGRTIWIGPAWTPVAGGCSPRRPIPDAPAAGSPQAASAIRAGGSPCP